MRAAAWWMAVALAAAPAAGHAVYRCTGANGVAVYQQQPCDGGKAVNLSGAGEADFRSPGAVQARREVRAAEVQANINAGRIGVGMTASEAARAWGTPSRVNSTVTAGGSSEQWVYRRGRRGADYVYVTDGVVTAVQSSY